ncbi:hypothetical protein [Microbacterium sp. NIBRBAC000506063]|uniref:hypothetical protein n=1 Tax=Microbacterium sp. NIBRBAC000506063 TaxID=2734618 RepID=UPI001BB62978|nr:hypothetical protein [Microbacterium sp. NIBRBAC000506063]QTV79469.1 hypothetical protein KAE78_11235 [Microbacterium sp. NIBRBAC000506063]
MGLLVPHGAGLRAAVKPKRRDALAMPLPIVVSIARAVQKTEVAMAGATPTPPTTRTGGRAMADYRIEYTIYRDDEEIGFGSSASWSTPQQAAHILSSDIDNYQWETESGHPDPARSRLMSRTGDRAMADGFTRGMTRKVRAAYEFYMVTQEGMSAGDALRAFDRWHEEITAPADVEVGRRDA